jgi:hypothetical protein
MNTVIIDKSFETIPVQSNLFLLFEANVDVRFILSSLLIQSFEDFVGIGVHVKVHLFVVVFEKLSWVIVQKVIYFIVGLQISSFSRYYMHNQVLKNTLIAAILDMNSGRIASIETFHRPSEYS